MNREDIIEMAKDAGAFIELSTTPEKDIAFLEKFASIIEMEAKGVRPCCMEFESCKSICVPRGIHIGRQQSADFLDQYAKRFDDIRRAVLEVAAENLRETQEKNISKTIVIDKEDEE